MAFKELWQFPVVATCIMKAQFINKTADALILFDYYDEEKNDTVYNAGILFEAAQAYRFSSEKFVENRLINDAYAVLIEYSKSDWLNELYKRNQEIAQSWEIKHFAIYLDSNGCYEVIAKNFKILETKEGPLKD
jgi:hypothetical protein